MPQSYAEGLNLLILALPDSAPQTADKLWIKQVSCVGDELMGYRAQDLVSKPLTVICPERLSDVWNAAWRSWQLGGGATHTIWCRNHQGEVKAWEVTFSVMTGQEVAVLLQDVESRDEIPRWGTKIPDEPELVAIPNAMIQLDQNRQIIEWNDQAEALFGWSRLDALGQQFPDFLITPEMLASSNEVNQEPSEDQQNAVVKIDEAGRIADWNSKAETLFGYSRQDALGQLFPSFLITQDMLSNSNDIQQEPIEDQQNAVIKVSEDGRIAGWNSKAEALLGYSSQDALDQPFPTFLITQDMLPSASDTRQEPREDQQNAVIKVSEDGRIAGWNSKAEALFGYSSQDALGQPFPSCLITPDMLPSSNEVKQEPTEDQQNAVVKIGVDGRISDWNKKAEALFGRSYHDALGQPFPSFLITPEMLASASEDQQNAVVKVSKDGRIVDWNSKAEVLFGHSKKDALGQPFPSFLIPTASPKMPSSTTNFNIIQDNPGNLASQSNSSLTQHDAPAQQGADTSANQYHKNLLNNLMISKNQSERTSTDTTVPVPNQQKPAVTPSVFSKAPLPEQHHTDVVAQIQQSMLPVEAIDNRDFEVCAFSASRSRPGGAFLDYFSRRSGTLNMTMMDTAEHGQDAALRMLEIRGVLRAHGNSPAQALTVLDEFLSATLAKQGFTISMNYLEYNAHKQQLSYANAGHLSGLLCRRTKATCQPLDAEGSVIGASQKIVYEENNQHINSGDSVVLYSDALLALKNTQGEPFGLKRLSDLLSRFCKNSAQQILDEIIAELTHFSAKQELNEDVAALVFKRK